MIFYNPHYFIGTHTIQRMLTCSLPVDCRITPQLWTTSFSNLETKGVAKRMAFKNENKRTDREVSHALNRLALCLIWPHWPAFCETTSRTLITEYRLMMIGGRSIAASINQTRNSFPKWREFTLYMELCFKPVHDGHGGLQAMTHWQSNRAEVVFSISGCTASWNETFTPRRQTISLELWISLPSLANLSSNPQFCKADRKIKEDKLLYLALWSDTTFITLLYPSTWLLASLTNFYGVSK